MATIMKVKGSSAPADSFTIPLMDGYSVVRPTGNTTKDIPGRKNPIVFFHPTKGRRGTFTFVLGTAEATATAFDTFSSRKVTFTLSDSDRSIIGMDFVVADEGVTLALDDDTREVWIATVPFVEQ